LCPAKDFLALARDPESPKHYGVPGPTLEGYLFPDTYALPRGTGCAAIVQTMIARFKRAWDEAQKQRAPEVKLNELQAGTRAAVDRGEGAGAVEGARARLVRVSQPDEAAHAAADRPDGDLRDPALARLQVGREHPQEGSFARPSVQHLRGQGAAAGADREPGR